MKKIAIIIILALAASCSSDDGESNNPVNEDALVNQIVFSYSQGFTGTSSMIYDPDGRDSEWSFSGLQVYRELPEPLYPNGDPVFTYTLNLNPQGLIAETYTKNNGQAYARYYTYDSRNRVIKEEVHEQFINGNTGTPNTNLELFQTWDLTWDDDDNLISIKMQYPSEPYYHLITFSDFTSFRNTLKPANFGFDLFGPHGYPAEDLQGGGNGGFYYRQAYAGERMPAKKVGAYYYTANNEPYPAQGYVYNISYQKDNQGRITEVLQEQEDINWWYKTRYNY